MQPRTITRKPPHERKRFHINSVPQTDKALENWRRDGIITDDDAQLLRKYLNERSSQRHLAVGTRNKILF